MCVHVLASMKGARAHTNTSWSIKGVAPRKEGNLTVPATGSIATGRATRVIVGAVEVRAVSVTVGRCTRWSATAEAGWFTVGLTIITTTEATRTVTVKGN